MKRLLTPTFLAFFLSFLPSLVEAQGWIRYYPPQGGFTGGTLTSPLLFSPDNTHDIGAPGSRPRNIYAGTSFLAPDGTAGAPSISFASDTNTGIFSAGANLIGVSANGAERVRIGATPTVLNLNGGIGFGSVSAPDASIFNDAANILAQRNGTNAQTFRLYNTFTDASNLEYITMRFSANEAQLLTFAAGTGTARALAVGTIGSAALRMHTNGAYRWNINTSGHLLAEAHNTYDIGSTTLAPRTIYTGLGAATTGSAVVGGVYCVNTTSQATTGTTEEILATCTLPANAMSTNGKVVRITAWFDTANNANSKTARVRFGGIGGSVASAATTTVALGLVRSDITLIRTGASAQLSAATTFAGIAGGAAGSVFGNHVAHTQAETGTIAIVATGTTPTAAADLNFRGWTIEFFN